MSRTVALAAAAALSTSFLAGCGGGGGDGGSTTTSAITSPTTTTTAMLAGMTCDTEVKITTSKKMDGKGMCLDDASYFSCPDKMLQKFPHTEEPIKYVRLFKAFRPTRPDHPDENPEDLANQARESFVRYVKANNIQVLVGSQITCDKTADEEDWKWVQKLITALGKDHVLALAVGNELDLLYQACNDNQPWCNRECLTDLWGSKEKPGYLYDKTVSRIKWARDATGNSDLPVTSVMTAGIMYSDDAIFPDLCEDDYCIKLMTYLNHVYDSNEKNYVFVVNLYPIFDPTLKLDAGKHTCDQAMKVTACYDGPDCKTIYNGQRSREKTDSFVQSRLGPTAKARLWIGEIGWSAPKPDAYGGPMYECDNFFSHYQLYSYYKNFLEWDLSLALQGSTHDPPEYVFYFTMRDAVNFGKAEHFGLVQDCSKPYCKIVPDDTGGPALPSGTVV